jgi:hypothetical protein
MEGADEDLTKIAENETPTVPKIMISFFI